MDYFFGIVLIIWGLISLRAFFLNKNQAAVPIGTAKYLFKFIFGDHYDKAMNLVFGIIKLGLGLFIIYKEYAV